MDNITNTIDSLIATIKAIIIAESQIILNQNPDWSGIYFSSMTGIPLVGIKVNDTTNHVIRCYHPKIQEFAKIWSKYGNAEEFHITKG